MLLERGVVGGDELPGWGWCLPVRRNCEAHRVPADGAPVWQQRMRISLTAGEMALAKDDMVAEVKEMGASGKPPGISSPICP